MHDIAELLKGIAAIISGAAWPLAVVGLAFMFRVHIQTLCDGLVKQIPRVNNFEVAGVKAFFSAPEPLLALPKADDLKSVSGGPVSSSILTQDGRASIYNEHRGVFLSHTIERKDSGYGIQIFLIGHEKKEQDGTVTIANSLNDVQKAEFYLGDELDPKENKVVTVEPQVGKPLGINVTSSNPFLCTCVVTFNDGQKIDLNRYIDLSMSWAVSPERWKELVREVWKEATRPTPIPEFVVGTSRSTLTLNGSGGGTYIVSPAGSHSPTTQLDATDTSTRFGASPKKK
jgi:hypothetical protein